MKTITQTCRRRSSGPRRSRSPKSIGQRPEDRLPAPPRQHQRHDDARGRADVYARRSGTPARRSKRDEAHEDERHAEHERRRRPRTSRPETASASPRSDPGEREHEASATSRDGRLGEVPDRRRDRHHAHAPGRDGDDDEREQHAEREGDHEARERTPRTRSGSPRRHPQRRTRRPARRPSRRRRAAPSSAPTHGGDEVVGDPLEREHLDEVPPARADRARDAELAAPLGGEHDEDQEDQQDAGGDREACRTS